jgi:hypothetical protein
MVPLVQLRTRIPLLTDDDEAAAEKRLLDELDKKDRNGSH